jgi:hypothetical protein
MTEQKDNKIDQSIRSNKENSPPYNKFNPHLFTIFLWVGVLFLVLGAYLYYNSIKDSSKFIAFLFLFIGVQCFTFANIYFLICLYRCWSILQKLGIARTYPGRAVGFLFVPVFNIYWIFHAIPGLASDASSLLSQNHIVGKINIKLSLDHTILFIIPFLNIFCLITSTILIYQYANFYNAVVDNWDKISKKSYTNKEVRSAVTEKRTNYVAALFILVAIVILAAIAIPQIAAYKSNHSTGNIDPSHTTTLPYNSLSPDNLKEILSTFPKQEDHPNAAAIALLQYSRMEMLNDGTIIHKNISRYKIFNERGYYLASKSIGYREGYEEVKILFANTIRPDGTRVPLNEKDIQDSAPYSAYEYYTDIKEKSFTMPAIEPDCIVEYAYEVKTIKPVLHNDLYTRFFIQSIIPLKEDVMEIILPKGKDLHIAYFKTDIKPFVEEADGKIKYTFKNLNKTEIIPEPRMPDMYDKEVFPQFYCWTLSSWDTISKWYSELTKEQMQSDAELESFTKALIANKTTDEDKIRAIFYFVSQKIRYVAVELGPHTHKPHLAYEVFKKRYGDCKDKTTLLLTMLKIAGIEGIPGLVPKDPEELDESAPTSRVFNHVIAVVPKKDGTYYWLDATNEVAAFDSVPFYIPNTVLLISMDGNYKFVKTPEMDDNKDYIDFYRINLVNDNGDVDNEYTYSYYGKSAEIMRQEFKYMSPEKRRQYYEEKDIEVSSLEIFNLTELELPFVIKVKGLMRNSIQKIDDNLMVLPGAASILAYNDLTTGKSRQYPISFAALDLIKFKQIYYFPKGYKIKKLPGEFKREDPYNKSYIKYKFEGNVFSIERQIKNLKYKIEPDNFDSFKKDALERQKYKRSMSNIIFERK